MTDQEAFTCVSINDLELKTGDGVRVQLANGREHTLRVGSITAYISSVTGAPTDVEIILECEVPT